MLKCLTQDLRLYQNHREVAIARVLCQGDPKAGGAIRYSIGE